MAACLMLLAMTSYDAWGAAAEVKYELIADGVAFGNDMILTGLESSIFHQQSFEANT